jgi:hypothetical protein
VNDKATTGVVLKEMEQLLRVVASSGSPPRPSAVRYTQCRDSLLASDLRSTVPGFVVQCVSIYKFHDFINLYHSDVGARLAFIESAFGTGGGSALSRRPSASFNDFDF